MKVIIISVLMLLVTSLSQANYPQDSLANRMEHCEVKSVQGSWAMANYPNTIDLYYGKLFGERQWEGFIVFGFPAEENNVKFDKLKLYPVQISMEQTATYAGDTAIGTTQAIRFHQEKYDYVRDLSTYTLEYTRDSGTYECLHTWTVGIPH